VRLGKTLGWDDQMILLSRDAPTVRLYNVFDPILTDPQPKMNSSTGIMICNSPEGGCIYEVV